MYRVLCVFCLFFVFSACKNEKKHNNVEKEIEAKINDKSGGKSILDLEYLNDTLNIAVIDIKVLDKGNSDYEIEVVMETPDIEKYSKDHKFFIHCYYYEGMEDGNIKFMPIGTNKIDVIDNRIHYKRAFTSELDIFKNMRYGLLNTVTNERYFTLKIDTVSLAI